MLAVCEVIRTDLQLGKADDYILYPSSQPKNQNLVAEKEVDPL